MEMSEADIWSGPLLLSDSGSPEKNKVLRMPTAPAQLNLLWALSPLAIRLSQALCREYTSEWLFIVLKLKLHTRKGSQGIQDEAYCRASAWFQVLRGPLAFCY